MSRSHFWSLPYNIIILALVLFSRTITASLSLQALQPIAQFPAVCEAAYQAPIQNCPDASSFSLTGASSTSPVCTTNCYIALVHAIASIQSACQGSAAPPGTVIAHAFSGDLATWLCGVNGGTNSQSSSVATSSSSGSTTQSGQTSNAASSTSSNPTSSSSAPSSAASSTSSSISASSSSTLTSTATSTSSSSTTTTLTKSTKSSSPSSTTPKPEPTLNAGGGGSPFDQTVPNAAPTPLNGQKVMSFAIGVAMAVALGS